MITNRQKAGDVMFFNGSLVHGSGPNHSANSFRRALIGHYIEGNTQEVDRFYHPVLRMNGTIVEIDEAQAGSKCGIWVDRDGEPAIELDGIADGVGSEEQQTIIDIYVKLGSKCCTVSDVSKVQPSLILPVESSGRMPLDGIVHM